eukprot:scaffold84090_cov30-Tisochrysis_lutea.AAC.1
MVLAFGLFFPAAIAASTGWRYALSAGIWFKVHAALSAFGVIFALAGFIIAISMTAAGSHFNHGHEAVGLVVLLLALLQPAFTIACRGIPRQEKNDERLSRARRFWEVGHRAAGLLMVILSIYVVVAGYVRTQDLDFYGQVGEDIQPPPMAITVILYAIFLTAALIMLVWGIKRTVGLTFEAKPHYLRTTSSAFLSRPIDPRPLFTPRGNTLHTDAKASEIDPTATSKV